MPNAPKYLPSPRRGRPARVGSSTARGYGYAHQQHRARLLAERPLCERCGAAFSHHLHHRDRDTRNRDDANAEMLCVGCHQAEHRGGA